MELCAEPHGRPKELTKQYLFFIGYRADGIPYRDLLTAYEILTRKELIGEEEGYVKLIQQIKTEHWHYSGKKWRRAEPETANLILYFKMKKDMNGKGQLFGFIDAMIGQPPAITLIKSR